MHTIFATMPMVHPLVPNKQSHHLPTRRKAAVLLERSSRFSFSVYHKHGNCSHRGGGASDSSTPPPHAIAILVIPQKTDRRQAAVVYGSGEGGPCLTLSNATIPVPPNTLN